MNWKDAIPRRRGGQGSKGGTHGRRRIEYASRRGERERGLVGDDL